jgi:7-carboxy-7-deazaguanine synthase
VFVRFAACNLWSGEEADRSRDAARTGATCPTWCDTDFRSAGAARLSARELVEAALAVAGEVRFLVLTGGEPLLQADAPLVSSLREGGFFVACETNGTVSLAGAFGEAGAGPDWVVCSPKLPEERMVIEAMDELKLVVPDYRPEMYPVLACRARTHHLAGVDIRYLWLQPEDGPRQTEAAALAVSLALADPRWRVSVQTHKVLGVQ